MSEADPVPPRVDEERWISDFHGLELSPDADAARRGNENGILFLAEYYMLKDMLGELTQRDKDRFRDICESLQSCSSDGAVARGVFDRGAGESRTHQPNPRTPSHDNLTAIACFSFKHGLRFHRDIATRGRKTCWRFDNHDTERPRWNRIQHPRDVILWDYIGAGGWLATLLLPLLVVILLEECFRLYKYRNGNRMLGTDGKLLTFVRIYHTKDRSWVLRWCGLLCHLMLRWRWGDDYFVRIFAVYFHQDPMHPCNVLARRVRDAGVRWWC